MNEPPNSRYRLPVRSGQPIVWMTRSSGFATFQTSFTPSSQTCGSSPRRVNRSSATPVRCPWVPSASTVTFATRSEPASKLASSPPSRPRPLSPLRTPTTRPCETRSFCAAVSGRIIAPASSARSARKRPSCESRKIQLPWLRIGGGGGRGSAAGSSTDGSSAPLADELGQLRHDLVQVADDAEVAELEDRRVRVFVDRDDRAGALHADLVLDGAGDAERDVELRRHGLAGLADLGRVRVPAGVDDSAGCADRSTERLRELLREREVVGRAEASAAGDDHVGVLDRGAARLLRVLTDELHRRRILLVRR